MTLVSDSEMAALRSVALTGMQTSVTIQRHTTTITDYGSQDVWTDVTTVDGWITELTPNAATIGEIAGTQTLATIYRLFLPVGTDIGTGDRVIAGSQTFTVQHSNAESTYLPMLTVSMKKEEG